MRPRRIIWPLRTRPGSDPGHGSWLWKASSRLSVHDGAGQGLELLAATVAVEAVAGSAGVVEGDRPRAVEGAGLGDADQGAVELAAAQRAAHRLVLAGGEDQRERRRALAEVGAGDLAGLDRFAGAVEDVVRDLERDSEREAELAEPAVAAAAEQARRLEQLPRLERAALEVTLDARFGVVRLRALERLAPRERERRARQDADRGVVAGARQLRERAGEEVVAGRPRRGRPVARPRCGAAAAVLGPVDQVVVDERRRVDELDGRARSEGIGPGRRCQEHE